MPRGVRERQGPNRRSFLAMGAVAAATALGGGTYLAKERHPERPTGLTGLEHFPQVPVAAMGAGMKRVVFSDDFTSATVDSGSTGAGGHNWYTDLPFGWGRVDPGEYSVNSSVLRVDPARDRANWTLASASPRTRAGRTFGHGYFEARIRFPARAINAARLAWPAFWALGSDHVFGGEAKSWAELDVMEAHGRAGSQYEVLGSVHEWSATSHLQNAANSVRISQPVDDWVRYACLWTRGSVRWFIEDVEVLGQQFGPTTVPSPGISHASAGALAGMDEQALVLVLGSGAGWPMEVDWVRVWA